MFLYFSFFFDVLFSYFFHVFNVVFVLLLFGEQLSLHPFPDSLCLNAIPLNSFELSFTVIVGEHVVYVFCLSTCF